MLDLAFKHKEEILRLYHDRILSGRMMYFVPNSYLKYDFINIQSNSWTHLQMVSIGNRRNINGYISASIDRDSNSIVDVSIVSFSDDASILDDAFMFFYMLFFVFNFRSAKFYVVCGNPAEKLFDRMIDTFDGKIVGIFEEDARLRDGNLYDTKYYQVMRDDIIYSGKHKRKASRYIKRYETLYKKMTEGGNDNGRK